VASPRSKHGEYWDKRKDAIYLFAAREICKKFCPSPRTVIDIGSNGTPTLEWHRERAGRLISLDLRNPYVAPGVESITADFLSYEPGQRFDLATCLQVLEHVPEPKEFALKLLQVANVAVVSVPYKWPKQKCKYHVHDPVDEEKMHGWFGRAPDFSYLARELTKTRRLINVYRS
jgi:hypothetical protein